jgi:hypothetical protein
VKSAVVLAVVMCALAVPCLAAAQTGMPDLRQMSGVPLPASDLATGSVSVRVVRGSFANNVTGVPVTFVINGRPSEVQTDAAGRAEVSGVAVGSRLRAFVVVDGERLETQEVTIGQGGFRFVLSTGASTAAGAGKPAMPAVTGEVSFGPESRVIAQLDDDRLFLFYVLSIVNREASPVDTGGPLTIDLPQGARGATMVEDSPPTATASGPRVIVAGPFAPGATRVSVRFELPYSGPTAEIRQRWPVRLQALQVFALKTGELGLRSPQISGQRTMTEQGQPIIVAAGPGMAAGEWLTLDITGLPYHPVWPRYVALAAAGAIVTAGLWAGIAVPGRQRRPARDRSRG